MSCPVNHQTKSNIPKSEDVLGERWDRCLVDTGIKLAGGFAIGTIFSLLLFKRRSWPIVFGVGSGFGMGYQNCQAELNKKY